MPDDTHAIAAAWVDTLAARGVTLRAKGAKRFEMLPRTAYREMSDDEHLTLRHHRADIVAILIERGGVVHGVIPAEPAPPLDAPLAEPEPEPTPAPCPYCHKPPDTCATMRVRRLDAWRAIHYHHPEVVEERRAYGIAEMYESLRRQRYR